MKRDTPLLLKPTEQPISLDVLREKYLKADEQTVGDLYARVAKALASVEALGCPAPSGKRVFWPT
jgi:ribonucleoside-diphosphate reductase alpha chain